MTSTTGFRVDQISSYHHVKPQLIKWESHEQKEIYCVVARSIIRNYDSNNETIMEYDLEELELMIRSCMTNS
ncbi:MAG: hypothetical protein LUQ50_06445 [Methanospirillum sp.]|uniref:hypothetical protein n=1 Tax=Methanospirillum sp. TaxID=45200 RepID=UPI00236D4F21|nr:hypothetical protein [Methanospirillum sp.]MDD1728693.1 hypothetical protein [Methanospirillum sp.]